MDIKEFLKPTSLKVSIFLFIGVIFLYLVKENICAVGGFLFAFCYNVYGFPFSYLITGDIDVVAQGHVKTLFLGGDFVKYWNTLFNVVSFLLDILLIYAFACIISIIYNKPKKLIKT